MTEIAHGTRAGYRAHRKAKETPCGPCRAAEAAYARERRSKEKPTAPAANAPAIPDGAITYVAVAEEGVGRWTVSIGYLEQGSGSQTVLGDDTLGLPVGERLVDGFVELVKRHRATVLLVSRDDAPALTQFDLTKKLEDCKVAVVEPPVSWVPDTDGSRAQHLARTHSGMITYAARVKESRAELDRELAGEEPKHRVLPATVARGKMFPGIGEDNRFIKSGTHRRTAIDGEEVELPVYDELPQGHPGLSRESYISGSDPRAEKMALRRRRP